jgi:serine/threonine protein phosphatase PrpC
VSQPVQCISGGFFGVQQQFELRNLIPQQQTALFEAPQCQLIHRGLVTSAVDQAVKVGMLHPQLNEATVGRMKVLLHGDNRDDTRGLHHTDLQGATLQRTSGHELTIIVFLMSTTAPGYRLAAATGLHRGDRLYQQDQVEILPHPRVSGCLLGVVADGMGGKSGGRKAADQVILTARQIFERYVPSKDDAALALQQLLQEAHLMIKLTAIAFEEEPHSTLAAFIVNPDRSAAIVHAGDSRVYHFRQSELVHRTLDHSFVQRLINEGQLTEEEAQTHPQSNLLVGCLGTQQDPPQDVHLVDHLETGDCLMVCSDGLWHYFTPREMGAIVHTLPPREAAEMLIGKARHRARGGGDNLSVALVRVEPAA